MSDVLIRETDGAIKVIGTFADGVFYKEVKKSKHLFRKMDAWGIDSVVFERLIKPQGKEIKVFDKEEKMIYCVSVEDFDKQSVFLHFKPHRAQRFLPRDVWKKSQEQS